MKLSPAMRAALADAAAGPLVYGRHGWHSNPVRGHHRLTVEALALRRLVTETPFRITAAGRKALAETQA
jgi:hypothetical protein